MERAHDRAGVVTFASMRAWADGARAERLGVLDGKLVASPWPAQYSRGTPPAYVRDGEAHYSAPYANPHRHINTFAAGNVLTTVSIERGKFRLPYAEIVSTGNGDSACLYAGQHRVQSNTGDAEVDSLPGIVTTSRYGRVGEDRRLDGGVDPYRIEVLLRREKRRKS